MGANPAKHMETSRGGQIRCRRLRYTTRLVPSFEDFTQLIVDLLSFGQTLCKHTLRIGERLCHEVLRATQGKARLLLPCQGQCQRLDSQVSGHLTRREQGALALICRGNDQQTIAAMLSITPTTVDTYRKHICWKLGVHSERAIPLAAYHAGLFSVLNESSTGPNASFAGVMAPHD